MVEMENNWRDKVGNLLDKKDGLANTEFALQITLAHYYSNIHLMRRRAKRMMVKE